MPNTDVADVLAAPDGATDPLQQLILAQLAGDADDGLSMPDLLARALGNNPLAGQIAAILRKRQEVGNDQPEDIPEPDDPLVTDVLTRLYNEVEILRARTGVLADALGACPRCWGEDIRCPRCRGRGVAGGRPSDPALFEAYVAPVIRRRGIETTTQPLAEHQHIKEETCQ